MKRRTHSNLLWQLVALLLVSALIGACGSASKESGGTVSTGGVQTIGATECYNCHADKKNPASFDIVFGDSGVVNTTATHTAEGWINGPHGNNETWDGTIFTKKYVAGMNTGFPDYAEFTDSTCQTCHDPLGEGKTLPAFFTKTGITVLGIAERPVIGCEACHGGGGNHFGVGPLPYAKPNADRCGQCHSSAFPDSHLPFHPEGDNIVNDYKASSHASSINEHTYVTAGDPSVIRAKCSRCHTDEGAKLYVPVTSGTSTYGDFKALDSLPNVSNASTVQCRTCHDGHNPFKLLGEKDAAAPVAWSEEFKTCTQCHQLFKATGALNDQGYHAPYDSAGNVVNAFGSWEEIIAETHYDNPATLAIQGYNVVPSATHDPSAKNNNTGTCRDCHNPHRGGSSINYNRQWAKSAHGGFVLRAKEEVISGATNTNLVYAGSMVSVWGDRDWKQNTGGSSGLGSRACQRCHTSTGFRNYANNPSTYDANLDTYPDTLNVFSHLTGSQTELLYCWGCHTDNIGGMRNPGAIVANYNTFLGSGASATLAASVSYTYPDVSKSNVCMACHTGRENGDSIKLLNTQATPTSANFSNLSFISSHYLTAGGTVFTATGYEYDTRSYANVEFYEHDKIGSAAAPNTGTSGPCVGCHMSPSSSHLFLPISKDEATGAITGITATVCVNCHTGQFVLSVSELEHNRELLSASLNALVRNLDGRGIYNRGSSFYRLRGKTGTVDVANGSDIVTSTTASFISAGTTTSDRFKVNRDGIYYSIKSVNSETQITLTAPYVGATVAGASYAIIRSTSVTDWRTGDNDNTGATSGKNNMGAAFNLILMANDPGAYAHNRYYAKRLIYDAIDWADNGILDYSTGTTLNGLDATDHPYKVDAMAYLLAGGVATGTSAERP